jgi:cytidyltransferase-like protein
MSCSASLLRTQIELGRVKRKIVVAVCGGFDPVHVGHLRHFKAAKELGDTLVVMLNSDSWLMNKRGYVFMPFEERKEIIKSIRYVDKVVPYVETASGSVAKTLEKLRPDIFAKGGDRTTDTLPRDGVKVCQRLGIRLVTGVGGGKVQSSSWLVKNVSGNNNSVSYVLRREK